MTAGGSAGEAAALRADFLSGDARRIWEAAGAVIATHDRALLRALAPDAAAIRAACAQVDLGGLLRRNRTHLEFALQKLAFAEGEACLCGLYPAYDMFDPAREAEAGHVVTLSETLGEWSAETRLRCADCGQLFRVVTRMGGHYAVWLWETVGPDAGDAG